LLHSPFRKSPLLHRQSRSGYTMEGIQLVQDLVSLDHEAMNQEIRPKY
jgi:hypothetical protein